MHKHKESDGEIWISLRFENIGQGFIKESEFFESALTRPFERILREGKPTGKINYVFFGEDEFRPPLFVVGSVCLTERGRLVFFPGVKKRIYIPRNSNGKARANAIVDHLTLDTDYSCHITFADGNHMVLCPRVPTVEPYLHGWFSLSISRLSSLEILPEILQVTSPNPLADAQRRTKDIIDARKLSVFHLLHLHNDDPVVNADEFLHIDVFVDLKPRIKRKNIPPSPPMGPPTLTSPIDLKPPFALRNHKVKIPGFTGVLHFLVSKHTGQVSSDAFFKGVGAP